MYLVILCRAHFCCVLGNCSVWLRYVRQKLPSALFLQDFDWYYENTVELRKYRSKHISSHKSVFNLPIGAVWWPSPISRPNMGSPTRKILIMYPRMSYQCCRREHFLVPWEVRCYQVCSPAFSFPTSNFIVGMGVIHTCNGAQEENRTLHFCICVLTCYLQLRSAINIRS